MSPQTRTRRHVRLANLIAAVTLAGLCVVAVGGPASAHDELLGTDPADGTSVAVLPPAITLTFSEAVATDIGGNEVQVVGDGGVLLAAGDLMVDDNVVTQPIAGSAAGAVTVTWRVVSDDGHPVSGTFTFTVAGPPSPSPTPSPTASVTPAPTSSPTGVATASPQPTATSDAASDRADPVPWIVLGVVLIAAVGGVVYLLVSRTRRRRGPRAGGPRDR